jgi:hypothetical protein
MDGNDYRVAWAQAVSEHGADSEQAALAGAAYDDFWKNYRAPADVGDAMGYVGSCLAAGESA